VNRHCDAIQKRAGWDERSGEDRILRYDETYIHNFHSNLNRKLFLRKMKPFVDSAPIDREWQLEINQAQHGDVAHRLAIECTSPQKTSK
jgi:hypothetical protein